MVANMMANGIMEKDMEKLFSKKTFLNQLKKLNLIMVIILNLMKKTVNLYDIKVI